MEQASATADAASAPGAPQGSAALAGPDFFCVGLQKAGTQWLYDQLQHHPEFWMPPIKELHFFDRKFPDKSVRKGAEWFVKDPKAFEAHRLKEDFAPIDDRAAAFLRRVAAFDPRDDSLDDYASLFAPKGGQLSGDITPGYSTLGRKTIQKLAQRFDRAKVVLMLREPASRLWSAWRMHCDLGLAPWLAVRNFKKFQAFADRKGAIDRSYPTVVAEKWASAFGDRFRVFFLDDVIARPAETRAEIIAFLGGDPTLGSMIAADYNRKAKTRSPKRSDKVKALLRERFAEERVKCAETFGGPAKNWPDAPY